MKPSVMALFLFLCSFTLAQPTRIGMLLGDSGLRDKLQQHVSQAYSESVLCGYTLCWQGV